MGIEATAIATRPPPERPRQTTRTVKLESNADANTPRQSKHHAPRHPRARQAETAASTAHNVQIMVHSPHQADPQQKAVTVVAAEFRRADYAASPSARPVATAVLGALALTARAS